MKLEQLIQVGKLDEAFEIIETLEQHELHAEEFKVYNQILKSLVYIKKEDYQKGLTITTKIDTELAEIRGLEAEWLRVHNLICRTSAYLGLGDINQAVKSYEKSLVFFKKLDQKRDLSIGYNNIGNLYHILRELEKASTYYENSLDQLKDFKNDHDKSIVLLNLISLEVQRGNKEKYQLYLQHLEEIFKIASEDRIIRDAISIARALVLKSSARVVNKAQAQRIFKEIANNPEVQYELTIIAKRNLCEMLLEELQESGSEGILSEIKELLEKLLTTAEEKNSSSLLTETYLILSKMAVLELNLDSARNLLLQAQAIAEENRIQRLEVVISRELDALLEQEYELRDHPTRDLSLAKRLELAELENMVTRIIRKKADSIDTTQEEPILFLILGRSGMSMFSKHFVSEALLADQLVAGFLTAINAFTEQAFSETGTIEGIKHREYTIILRPYESYLFCYVFKGASYFAFQKLKRFTEAIALSDTVLDILSDASTIGKDISEDSTLNGLAMQIFATPIDIAPPDQTLSFCSQYAAINLKYGIFLETFDKLMNNFY